MAPTASSDGSWLASASDDQSGLIVVNIPTASASIGGTRRAGVSLSAARADVVAVGTVRYLGGSTKTVAGTYDTETQVLTLGSGSGFDMTATFSGDAPPPKPLPDTVVYPEDAAALA